MTDKSIFTATRIRGEEKEFLGSVLLSSETDTASEFSATSSRRMTRMSRFRRPKPAMS